MRENTTEGWGCAHQEGRAKPEQTEAGAKIPVNKIKGTARQLLGASRSCVAPLAQEVAPARARELYRPLALACQLLLRSAEQSDGGLPTQQPSSDASGAHLSHPHSQLRALAIRLAQRRGVASTAARLAHGQVVIYLELAR